MRALRDFGLGIVDRLPKLKAVFIGEAAGLSGDLPKLLKGEAIYGLDFLRSEISLPKLSASVIEVTGSLRT